MKGLFLGLMSICSSCFGGARFLALFVVGMLLSLQTQAAQTGLPLVTLNETTGAPTFVPTIITGPIMEAIVLTICAVASIVVLIIGYLWIVRLCKGAR